MGALLKIVQPPAVVAQESACRVLNAGLVDRLGSMNAAVRTLRDMGYRVVAQTLFPVRGGKPEVLIRTIDGVLQEPVERLTVDVPEEHVGTISQLMGTRRARMVSALAALAT